MAPFVVERWEAEDGLGPYTTRYWPAVIGDREYWSSDLDMTCIPCPENDGIGMPMWTYLCACLPSRPAWSKMDVQILKTAGYRLMRYTLNSPGYFIEGNCQVVFHQQGWAWKEQVD